MIYSKALKLLQQGKFKYTEGSTCWEAVGEQMKDGYIRWGYFNGIHIRLPAHRAMYYLLYPDTPEDLYILHLCDNPKCIRPDHLTAGTQKNNIQDSYSKGRHIYQTSEFKPNAKLTKEDVEDIRGFLSLGCTQTKIASMYNMSIPSINAIANERHWNR